MLPISPVLSQSTYHSSSIPLVEVILTSSHCTVSGPIKAASLDRLTIRTRFLVSRVDAVDNKRGMRLLVKT